MGCAARSGFLVSPERRSVACRPWMRVIDKVTYLAGALLLTTISLVAPIPAGAQTALGLGAVEGAGALHDQAGETFTFVCPATDGEDKNVYGTDTYTDSSPICPAAIHAGVLQRGQAGLVTIRMGKGARSFAGTLRNGVTTRGYTAWPYSYEFVRDGSSGGLGWNTVWGGVPVEFTDTIPVRCPGAGVTGGTVWGTDVYTRDSAVCLAAVHAGIITLQDGGVIGVHRVPGATEYPGSRRNGVESRRWGGAYDDAFSIVSLAPQTIPGLAQGLTRLPAMPTPSTVLPGNTSVPNPTAITGTSAAVLTAPTARSTPALAPRAPATPSPPVGTTQPTPAPIQSVPATASETPSSIVIPPRTILLAGFAGVGSAVQPGPIAPRTIVTTGYEGVGSAPIPGPIGPRTLTLPGWTGVGSAP
jgi:hypothetical protein